MEKFLFIMCLICSSGSCATRAFSLQDSFLKSEKFLLNVKDGQFELFFDSRATAQVEAGDKHMIH